MHLKSSINKVGKTTLDVLAKLAKVFNVAVTTDITCTSEDALEQSPENPSATLKIIDIDNATNPVPLSRVRPPNIQIVTALSSPRVKMTKEGERKVGTPYIIPDDRCNYPAIDRRSQKNIRGHM